LFSQPPKFAAVDMLILRTIPNCSLQQKAPHFRFHYFKAKICSHTHQHCHKDEDQHYKYTTAHRHMYSPHYWSSSMWLLRCNATSLLVNDSQTRDLHTSLSYISKINTFYEIK